MALQSKHEVIPCYQDLVTYVLDHQNYDPLKPVFVNALDPGSTVSLSEAKDLVQKLVYGLTQAGLQIGDTICLYMHNEILYPILFLAIVGAGGRFTGANPAYTVSELEHHLKASETQFVICEQSLCEKATQAAQKCGISDENVYLSNRTETDEPDRLKDLADLMQHGSKEWLTFDDEQMSSATVSLMSTSGTTGLAKMAMRSHLSWVTENQAIEDHEKKNYEVNRLLSVPFFHAFAAPLAFISALRSGHTTYVMPRYDQDAYLTAVGRHRITETAMPPPLIARLVQIPQEHRQQLKSVKLVWSGGAVLPTDLQMAGTEILGPDARVCQVYGMTEGGWITTFHHPQTDLTGSVGYLTGSFEAKIAISANEDEKIDAAGEAGELYVRGPIAMSGYLNNPEETRKVLDSEGWLHTGDVAYIKDDKVYICARQKDMIKVNGWQVAPKELEDRLLQHAGISEAVVIGIPHHSEGTEVPRAYVVLNAGSGLDEGQVKGHLLQCLAKYKVNQLQVRFVTAIPKSATGKVVRHKLRELD